MIENNKTLFHHFKYILNSLNHYELQGTLDFDTFKIKITAQTRDIFLYPTFDVFIEDMHVFSDFIENARGFSGWRAYPFKEIELLANKIEAKKFFKKMGIPTPEYSVMPEEITYDFIIKDNHGSFSENIEGPFKPDALNNVRLDKNKYLEEFVPGKIIKAWFLNDIFLCLESRNMPIVYGDEKKSLRTLATEHFHLINKKVNKRNLETLLNFYGKTPDTVLKYGESQLIDFRYTYGLLEGKSYQAEELTGNEMVLVAALKKTANVIYNYLKKEMEGVVYTIDAIWNPPEKTMILEVNTHPGLHPYVYPAMISYLVGGQHEH